MPLSGASHPEVGHPTAGSLAGPSESSSAGSSVTSSVGSPVSSSLSSLSSSAWLTLSEWWHLEVWCCGCLHRSLILLSYYCSLFPHQAVPAPSPLPPHRERYQHRMPQQGPQQHIPAGAFQSSLFGAYLQGNLRQ